MEFPDSDTAVALALLWLILACGCDREQPTQKTILDAFGECLRAAKGDRGGDCAGRLH